MGSIEIARFIRENGVKLTTYRSSAENIEEIVQSWTKNELIENASESLEK